MDAQDDVTTTDDDQEYSASGIDSTDDEVVAADGETSSSNWRTVVVTFSCDNSPATAGAQVTHCSPVCSVACVELRNVCSFVRVQR